MDSGFRRNDEIKVRNDEIKVRNDGENRNDGDYADNPLANERKGRRASRVYIR